MLHRAVDPRSLDFVDALLEFGCTTGRIDRAAAARARSTQLQTGERIDFVLTELGLMSTDDLQSLASAYMELPIAQEAELAADHDLLETMPIDFLKRAAIAPLRRDGDRVVVAVADAFDFEAVSALSYKLASPLDVRLATRPQIMRVLDQALGPAIDVPAEAAKSEIAADQDVRRLRESASEAPIIRLVNRVISNAVRARASDIHFDRFQHGLVVRFRVDGILIEHDRIGLERAAATISRIKIMAGLNIAEHRLPQDGRIMTAVDGRETEIRVATTPVLYGETIVLRLLGRSTIDIDLATLGLEPSTFEFLMDAAHNPHGIVLVTGPTGSGKSTTLYALLKRLNNGERKIISIEDPVEVAIDGITQIPVRSSLGWGFAQVLRTILRHDPDVIMVGEMRDEDTARTGMQAAMTGHMVLSTLHTNSAVASITRLLDLKLEPYLLAATLNGVISQRLVRRLCKQCARLTKADDGLIKLCRIARKSQATIDDTRLRAAVGCEACLGTGYLGRTAITEVFVVTDDVRTLIAHGADETKLVASGSDPDASTLLSNGVLKILQGETTASEVLKLVRSGR